MVSLNDLIGYVAPGLALQREANRLKRRLLIEQAGGLVPPTAGASLNYDAASRSRRASDFRANRLNAVEAQRYERARISWIGRDMLRNNPRVVKAQRQLVGNIIGPGIILSVHMADASDLESKATIESLIRKHCFSRDIDAEGRVNLYGMQAMVAAVTLLDGEIIIRRRQRLMSDGYAMPWQAQALEQDFLNDMVDGPMPNGNLCIQGIEFDGRGRRAAYHLYTEHPGSRYGGYPATRRVPADSVIHVFDISRPGQERGVSAYASVVTLLHELQKYQDGQVKRQEIAALFAGILQTEKSSEEMESAIGDLSPGALLTIGSDEKMEFTDPPAVDGYEPFMRVTDRAIAAALGLTYEGFTGDYSNVNYSSARMGRMDTDPVIQHWQRNVLIAQFCDPLAVWIKQAISELTDIAPDAYTLQWTPPRRAVVDPTKDYPAWETARRAGFASRRELIRESGRDPDQVDAEIIAEQAWAREHDIVLSSDAGATGPSAAAPGDAPAGNKNTKGK